jgi:hypothetical protein
MVNLVSHRFIVADIKVDSFHFSRRPLVLVALPPRRPLVQMA